MGLKDMLRALFPCGSVTGAPKVRAMEIIRELEAGPRGVYTGAIGHIAPSGDAPVQRGDPHPVLAGGAGEMGIGSGIVVRFQRSTPSSRNACSRRISSPRSIRRSS